MSPQNSLFGCVALCLCVCSGTDPSTTDTDTTADTSGSTATDPTTVPTGSDPSATLPTTEDPSETTDVGDTSTGDAPAAEGCDGAPLLAIPEDPAATGPWPVGARTITLGGLTVEVWYPAEPDSHDGLEPARYDIRQALPDSEVDKVPDAATPWQDCACYRDLPLDTTHGPYPAVIFVHGTASFRSQSLEQVTHWASRGFIVLAADHPGLWLKDLLGSLCGQQAPPRNLGSDIATLVGGIKAPVGDLAFIQGHVDSDRIGMAGHSAGGGAISTFGGVAQVLIPMAAGGVDMGEALRSTLVLGAQADKVVAYSSQQQGYETSPAAKRLVGIANAGHLAFSSLCSLQNAEGQDFLEIADIYDICGAAFAGALFDCLPSYTPDPINWAITNYTSAAVLEETLHCGDASQHFATLVERFPDVGEFQEAL